MQENQFRGSDQFLIIFNGHAIKDGEVVMSGLTGKVIAEQ